MNSEQLSKRILEQLEYFIDGYYLSGNGREEIAKIIATIIEENK